MNKLVDPYCKRNPSAFIEFTGLVTPCCWLVTSAKRYQALKEFMGDDFDKLFITQDKDNIKIAYKKLEDSWTSDNPFTTCLLVCGKNVSS